MIVSASYRTDIPAFYAEWFRQRFRDGAVRVANPYGGPPSTVPLRGPEVEGYVFWTRNAQPFLPALAEVAAAGLPFVLQFTITGYPRALDAGTIAPDRAVEQVRRIAGEHGPGCVVWRYDPVVFSSLTPDDSGAAGHAARFGGLAARLAGLVDEVVVSCTQVYRKTARNLGAAARAHRFAWWDPPDDAKRALLTRLAGIAAGHGLALTLCDQPHLRAEGVGEARCVDAERLARLAGQPLAAERRPHRRSCGCWASRDIGAYDSCPHGCAYCYAVSSRTAAKRRAARHDPRGEFLIPVAVRDAASGLPGQARQRR